MSGSRQPGWENTHKNTVGRPQTSFGRTAGNQGPRQLGMPSGHPAAGQYPAVGQQQSGLAQYQNMIAQQQAAMSQNHSAMVRQAPAWSQTAYNMQLQPYVPLPTNENHGNVLPAPVDYQIRAPTTPGWGTPVPFVPPQPARFNYPYSAFGAGSGGNQGHMGGRRPSQGQYELGQAASATVPYNNFSQRQAARMTQFGGFEEVGKQAQPGTVQSIGYDHQNYYQTPAFSNQAVVAQPSTRRQSEDHLSSLEAGRQLGRMESDIDKLQKEKTFLKGDSERYKRERDEARKELAEVKEENANLRGRIGALEERTRKAETPVLQFRTPAIHRRQIPSQTIDRRSALSGMPLTTAAAQSPPTFTPGVLFSPPHHETTPPVEVVTAGTVLVHFYERLEAWAVRYATETTRPLPDIPGANSMSRICKRLSNNWPADDLLRNSVLRKHLLVAIINDILNGYLGSGFIEKMEPLAQSPMAIELKNELLSTSPQDSARCHNILERRVAVLEQITQQSNYLAALEAETNEITHNIIAIMEFLIPKDDLAAARECMHQLVSDALEIAQLMILTPQEWSISVATNGNRWEPTNMIQMDPALQGQARLTENNGFKFVVRIGITPSITLKDYSSGVMSVREIHKKTVLLRENPKGRASSSASRSSPSIGRK